MKPRERKVLTRHCQRSVGGVEPQLAIIIDESVASRLIALAEGIEARLGLYALQLSLNDGVVLPEDESVFVGLITDDAELGIDIILHLILVAVKMVGGDIEHHGYVSLELIHVFKLKTAQLNHIHVVMVTSHLKGETLADITGKSHVDTGILKNMVSEQCGSGLTVATGDAHHLSIGITPGKFNFGNNRNPLCKHFLHDGHGWSHSGALYYFISVKDKLLSVSAILKGNVLAFKLLTVSCRNSTEIRQKHVKALVFRKNRSADTAFSAA